MQYICQFFLHTNYIFSFFNFIFSYFQDMKYRIDIQNICIDFETFHSMKYSVRDMFLNFSKHTTQECFKFKHHCFVKKIHEAYKISINENCQVFLTIYTYSYS